MNEHQSDTLASLRQVLAAPPLRRRGIAQLLAPATPASASNYIHTVPGDYWERMLTCSFTFTASATAARRTLALNFADGDGNIFNQTQIAANILQNVAVAQYGDLSQVNPIQGGTAVSTEGSATSPTGVTAIASLSSLPGGTYFVTAVVNMAGTLAQAVDANNIKLYNGGLTLYETLDNNIGSAPQTFGPFEIQIPNPGSIIAATIASGTTGSIYSVELTAVPAAQQGSFQFPDLTLEPGWQIQVVVGNVQTGDQLSGVQLLLERYASNVANGGLEDEQERWIRKVLRQELGGQ